MTRYVQSMIRNFYLAKISRYSKF